MVRRGTPITIAVLLCAAVSAWAVSAFDVRLAFAVPAADIVLGTLVTATAAVLAAFFVWRHAADGRLTDAVLAVAFGTSAILEGSLLLAPELGWTSPTTALWGRSWGRLVVAMALFAAAWLPDVTLRRRLPRPAFGVLPVVICTAILGWTEWREDQLPTALSGATGATGATEPSDGGGVVTSLDVFGWRFAVAVLLGAAAVRFARRSRVHRDEFLGWLGFATALMAAARLHASLSPPVYTDWVTTAEILRGAVHVVLLAGIGVLLVSLWRARLADAARAERRRVARELHDGLAQELAYLRTQSMLATRHAPEEERLQNMADAAQRALQETRLAIVELTDDELRLDHLLTELVRETNRREDCRIDARLDEVTLGERAGRDLARIAGEAIANAINHGRADRIELSLAADNGTVRLRVADDGCGFDTARLPADGFGLESMTERASELGGSCSIVSGDGVGTMVTVEVPRV